MTNRPTIAAFSLLCLSFLGCGITAFVDDPASVSGVSYWAAATHTLVPTETRYVGHTTAVYAETPIPNVVTQIPAWTTVTVTPIAWATPTRWGTAAAAVWATTTPVFITETPQPPQTTTPALPRYGFTTPEPRATAYYRVGSFYMNSDVIVRGEGQLVFRIVYTSQVANLADTNSQYFFVTVRITNQGDRPQRVIASDLFFIREVRRHGITLTGSLDTTE